MKRVFPRGRKRLRRPQLVCQELVGKLCTDKREPTQKREPPSYHLCDGTSYFSWQVQRSELQIFLEDRKFKLV